MKIGILKEGKIPPDSRVPLTPNQCARLVREYPFEIVVQPSEIRCFQDEDYSKIGIPLQADLSDCDILLGIKEVPVDQLIPNKTYFFFSHTIKEQAYNRQLLQSILKKKIRLIDYEVLKYSDGRRVIAFGFYAGMVGAHNALWAYGEKTRAFRLDRMNSYKSYPDAKMEYKKLKIPPIKIVITGTGRVGKGATQTLLDLGIQQVEPESFLEKEFKFPVFTKLSPKYYVVPKGGSPTVKQHFYQNPHLYKSIFHPFTKVGDIMINGIYWKNGVPLFFTLDEMKAIDFKIKVIADISCDIVPDGAIPSTFRATTIENPVYGYQPILNQETAPFQVGSIDMITIDNLPSEIPIDSSTGFGEQLIQEVIPELLKSNSIMLEKATIAVDGHLGKEFKYLEGFVNHGSQ